MAQGGGRKREHPGNLTQDPEHEELELFADEQPTRDEAIYEVSLRLSVLEPAECEIEMTRGYGGDASSRAKRPSEDRKD